MKIHKIWPLKTKEAPYNSKEEQRAAADQSGETPPTIVKYKYDPSNLNSKHRQYSKQYLSISKQYKAGLILKMLATRARKTSSTNKNRRRPNSLKIP